MKPFGGVADFRPAWGAVLCGRVHAAVLMLMLHL
jgi:hypothetical protein